jgi:hypothetical protein
LDRPLHRLLLLLRTVCDNVLDVIGTHDAQVRVAILQGSVLHDVIDSDTLWQKAA